MKLPLLQHEHLLNFGPQELISFIEDAYAFNSQFIRKIVNIAGDLSIDEGKTLYWFVNNFLPLKSNVVELGAQQGQATSWLAKAAQTKARVHAIDTWRSISIKTHQTSAFPKYSNCLQSFKANLQKNHLLSYVKIINSNLIKAAQEYKNSQPIGFLFIDANYNTASEEQLFTCWNPHLTIGGFFAVFTPSSNLSFLTSSLPENFLKIAQIEYLHIFQKL
ncbi:MAG: hypothetical protein RLZ12_573 [Bacillota bacterium]|jgi:hypothetical protein